jgi:hypothetical protein
MVVEVLNYDVWCQRLKRVSEVDAFKNQGLEWVSSAGESDSQ